MLLEKGIVYGPDFLINAGGVMNVYAEYLGGYNSKVVYQWAEGIYDTCLKILKTSGENKITTHEAAMQLAERRIIDIGKVKLAY